MKNNIFKVLFLLGLVFIGGNVEASNCNFGRVLTQGSRGEDVRCLQQYLIGAGYITGYNSADGVFGFITKQAVARWQGDLGIYPVSGVFDNKSMQIYYNNSSTNMTYYQGGSVLGASTVFNFNSQEVIARQKIEKALDVIEEAEDEIDDSNKNTSSAENDVEDAKDNIYEAIREFFIDKDFFKAEDWAEDAINNARDAIEKVDGGGDKDDARDAIEDAEDAIDEAQDEIDEAEDDGRYVREAKDLLDEARDVLEEAEDEFDDRDYDRAEDLARDAEELARDAVDAID